MNQDLLAAVLALDVYHRGYNRGLYINKLGVSSSEIGNLSIADDASALDVTPGEGRAQAISFFAQSYDLNGQKIIAYRGTDDAILSVETWDSLTGDPATGWGMGAGVPHTEQGLMAVEFYKAVTGLSGAALHTTGAATLVGQSLGGGLAAINFYNSLGTSNIELVGRSLRRQPIRMKRRSTGMRAATRTH